MQSPKEGVELQHQQPKSEGLESAEGSLPKQQQQPHTVSATPIIRFLLEKNPLLFLLENNTHKIKAMAAEQHTELWSCGAKLLECSVIQSAVWIEVKQTELDSKGRRRMIDSLALV